MKYTKFVVKVSRVGVPCAEYVQRIDRKPIQTMRVGGRALTAVYLVPESYERVDDEERLHGDREEGFAG